MEVEFGMERCGPESRRSRLTGERIQTLLEPRPEALVPCDTLTLSIDRRGGNIAAFRD